MMPHARVRCQPIPAARRQLDPTTPTTEGPTALGFALVQDHAEQWVTRTSSRRVRRPGDWMQAVTFMVGAGFCPRAGETTIRVAADIAARMHRSKDGTVAYGLDQMVRRLGLSRRCITTHVGYLRALGLLAWVEKGSSLRNALRARHGDGFGPGIGFKKSATIYAPTAPPVWDQAHGRRLDGTGYTARVIGVTDEGRARAVDQARARQAERRPAKPVDNPRPCTPSVQVPQPRTSVEVSGGKKDTTRARKNPTGTTVQQALWGMLQAREVQLHIWWTQGTCVRRLAYSLRPLLAAGLGWEEMSRELGRWDVRARPRNVAAFVTSEIRRRANSGLLVLPDGLVRPYRQAPADENRYETMLRRRAVDFAARWEETAAARARIRSLLPAARTRAGRIPRGLAEARPERVMLTAEEFDRLKNNPNVPRACETLWAEAEELAAARVAIERREEHWEMLPPGVLEYR